MPTKLKPLKTLIQRHASAPLVVDLCCGMGGISLAAKQLKMQIVAGLDIEPAATRTYRENFPDAVVLTGSVRSSSLIQECQGALKSLQNREQKTIVVSGPPCQGFSVAGPRDPNDPRNQILLAVTRFIVALQPQCALI